MEVRRKSCEIKVKTLNDVVVILESVFHLRSKVATCLVSTQPGFFVFSGVSTLTVTAAAQLKKVVPAGPSSLRHMLFSVTRYMKT